MILLLWEKIFEYKNSIFSSDVCYDLSLWWHLPNLDIAFKQIKIVKITKNILTCCFVFLPHILTRYKYFVHFCLHLFTIMYKCGLVSITFYGLYDKFTSFWVYLNSYYIAQMYYICLGPIFQCGFNCDIYLSIGLTHFGNFENWQVYICILHHFSMQIQL